MRKPFQIYHFFCAVCGKPFTAKRSHAKTCPKSSCRSVKLRHKSYKKQKPIKEIALEMEVVSLQPKDFGMEKKAEALARKKYIEEPPHIKEAREKYEARQAAEERRKDITKPQFVICAMNGGLMIKDNCGIIVHIDNVHTPYFKCLMYGSQLREKGREELPARHYKVTAVEILLANTNYIISKIASPQEGVNSYNVEVDVIKKEIIHFSEKSYFKGFG